MQQHPGHGSTCALRRDHGWCVGRLRDTREQSRLDRCAAESRRLSLEECCYWLLLCGEVDAAEDMADRRERVDPCGYTSREPHAAKFRRWARGYLRIEVPHYRREVVRKYLFCAWLCREALRRIEEERR